MMIPDGWTHNIGHNVQRVQREDDDREDGIAVGERVDAQARERYQGMIGNDQHAIQFWTRACVE